VDLLATHGIDVSVGNATCNSLLELLGTRPWGTLSVTDALRIANILLKHGASPRFKNGSTVLHYLLSRSSIPFASTLCEEKGRLNEIRQLLREFASILERCALHGVTLTTLDSGGSWLSPLDVLDGSSAAQLLGLCLYSRIITSKQQAMEIIESMEQNATKDLMLGILAQFGLLHPGDEIIRGRDTRQVLTQEAIDKLVAEANDGYNWQYVRLQKDDQAQRDNSSTRESM
jgi:hypothetical protein